MQNFIRGLAVQVDGEWLDALQMEGTASLESIAGGSGATRALYVNRSGRPVRFGGFRFALDAFVGIPSERIRIYKEGWTMASAAASVGYGECDFEVNPDYKKFAVSDPDNYCSSTPNRFTAEYVTVLNDSKTGQSLLAGFISSADQFTRFVMELGDQGLSRFMAYSSGDGIVVEHGQQIVSEELIFLEGADGYALLEEFASRWAKRMNALSWPHIPTGWCSWYYYFDKVTQQDVYDNAIYLNEHRDEFPVEYLQLDDGYQAALGDWLTPNEKFSDGLQALAQKVKECGLKPGIWLAPFLVEETSRLYAEHPDWMVKDEEGQTLWASEWRGNRAAVLDGTHPQAQQYLTEVFSTLRQWGYDYVKIDFLVNGCSGKGGCYHDRSATRAQALRRGVEAIRRGMGDGFILGCTTPLGSIIGLVNGERTGTDITPYWQSDRKIYKEAPTVPNVCRNIVNRAYMNGRLWVSDPDVHIARSDNNKMTYDEVVLWTTALKMVGGMLLFSDCFPTLTPERAALSKELLASHGERKARPLDIFKREYPAIWLAETGKGDKLVGLFNFNGEMHDFAEEVEALRKSGQLVGLVCNREELKLAPHTCRCFTGLRIKK